jgi:RNase P subunit RPR2
MKAIVCDVCKKVCTHGHMEISLQETDIILGVYDICERCGASAFRYFYERGNINSHAFLKYFREIINQ